MSVFVEKVTASNSVSGSGTSTATATSGIINGRIIAIHIAYIDTPPNTTDVTIAGVSSPSLPVLTVSNGATDGWRYPKASIVDTAGGAISGGYSDIYINDKVSVTIAQANDGDGVTVTIIWERD